MLNQMGYIKPGIRLPLIELDQSYHNAVKSLLESLSLIHA